MLADNPVSWFILLLLGIYGLYKFISKIAQEEEKIKLEKAQEIFSENSIDKRNIQAYNSYIKKKGYDYYEHYDGRY